jgi:hypothetical protein
MKAAETRPVARLPSLKSESIDSSGLKSFFVQEKLHKTGRRMKIPRSRQAQFCRVLRFWRLEKSISCVFSIRLNISIPPAGTIFSLDSLDFQGPDAVSVDLPSSCLNFPACVCLVSYPALCYPPLARGGLSSGEQVPDCPDFSS